jgi:hypothetical protein
MDCETSSPTSNGIKRVNQTIRLENSLLIQLIAEISQLWLKCLKSSQQLLEQFIQLLKRLDYMRRTKLDIENLF